MRIGLLSVVTLTLGSTLLGAEAGELRVAVLRQPSVSGSPPLIVQVVGDAVTITAAGPGKWEYLAGKQAFATMSVIPGNDPVTNYGALPFPVMLPFNETRPFKVLVVSTRKEAVSTNVAIELYATNIKSKDDPFLWTFYQRALQQALGRYGQIMNGREINESDVRVFFKVLEVTRDLGRGRHLDVSTELEEIKNYVAGIVDQPSATSIIERGLGTKNAGALKDLIQEIDELDADQYVALWRALKNQWDGGPEEKKKACEGLQLVRGSLRGMEESRANRILGRQGLDGLIASALNDCVGITAYPEIRATGTLSPETKAAIQTRVAATAEVLANSKFRDVVATPAVEATLRSQQADLLKMVR